MKIDLKGIFKNKLIIFILIFFTIVHFLFAIDLKAKSVDRWEDNYQRLEGQAKFDAMWKENDLFRARAQDTSPDKVLYNNYKYSYDWCTTEIQKLLKKYSQEMEIPNTECDQQLYLASLIRNVHYSGLYGKDQLSPYKAYPEKIEKFLNEIEFPYNFSKINYLSPSEDRINQGDLVNYNIAGLENMLDGYFLGKTLPRTTDYNIYNFIRSINYGQLGTFIGWMENFFIGLLPLVNFYSISQQKDTGTIKNIYLRPGEKYKNYLYFLAIFFISALVLIYLPKLISYLYVLISGDNYKAFTEITVVEKGLKSFETAYEESWADSGSIGLTNIVNGVRGDKIDYFDLKNISFSKFISYCITIDLLKVVLLVITATAISLFIKNKVLAFSLNGLLAVMTIMGGKSNTRFFLNKYNPFILPNGWKLTLGREYISWFNAFVLLIGWIIVMLVISLFLARKRDLE